jgi:hypothetical protein
LATAATQAARALQPLADLLATGNVVGTFSELGFVMPPSLANDGNLSTALATAGSAASALSDLVKAVADASGDPVALIEATIKLTKAIVQAGGAIDAIVQAFGAAAAQLPPPEQANAAAFAAALAERLLDYTVVTFLESYFPRLKAFLALLGVVEIVPVLPAQPDPSVPPVFLRSLHVDRVPQLLKSPQDFMTQEYGWGTPTFDGQLLLSRLNDLLFAFTVPAGLRALTPGAPLSLEVLLFTLGLDTDISPPGLRATFALGLSDTFTIDLPFFVDGWSVEIAQQGKIDAGLTAVIAPPASLTVTPPAGQLSGQTTVSVIATKPSGTLSIFALPEVGVLSADQAKAGIGVKYTFDTAKGSASGEPVLSFQLKGAKFTASTGQADNFLQSLAPSSGFAATNIDFGLSWSPSTGVVFTGGSLETTIPVHLTIGPIEIDLVRIRVAGDGNGLDLGVGAAFTGTIGPVSAIVDSLGVQANLKFSRGSLGPLDLGMQLLPPTGIGIDIDAGPVSGGGFLSFTSTRYSGAIELSVYGISVKAFGLLDTVLPDGTKGYSFVVVISAEFTPIQLGFGFTLLGVGGLVGINRTIDGDALEKAVIKGAIANILFPKDVVHDAPTIINDLATFFPGALGHYVFGPLGKLGWGTPTLITGKIGFILEIPGPRLSLLGLVQMALPTSNAALLSINLSIGGLLDFPGKLFWFEAALFDSQVVGFTIQGGMAFRLTWGNSPSFALAIGGFNPIFQPPAGFPDVKRCSIEVGINGNPSLTIQGYFALTSNSVQVGASVDLRASGFGIGLHAWLGFDALFIFSPFSFEADFSAGVNVTFLGLSLGISLDGTISGPTPWHVHAEACVSLLFFSVCLPVDFSFGTSTRPSLPQIDPWVGSSDAQNPVPGLQSAVQAPTNWSGGLPTGTHPVVTLTQADAAAPSPPIDPVGQATLHQKVCPLNLKLTKFGIYQPITHNIFVVTSVLVSGVDQNPRTTVQDKFAPGLFKDLNDSDKLKSPSYESLDSGFTIRPDQVTTDPSPPFHAINYDTDLIDNNGNDVPQPQYALTLRALTALQGRSAAAQKGIRRSGVQRFVDPTAPVKVTLSEELFVVADACSLAHNAAITPTALAFAAAQNDLDDHLAAQPSDSGVFRVVPSYLAA